MKEYHKIQSIYKRDPVTKRFLSEYSTPEIAYLANNVWVFTEKVDGTNIRVMLKDGKVHFGGKTDNAQMPIPLLEELQRLLPDELLRKQFPEMNDICLYGEGYGAGIQKGGCYGPVSFVLFDVLIGSWWLQRQDVDAVGKETNIRTVPVIGMGTLEDAIRLTSNGLTSTWGAFKAEGIVARPMFELFDRGGRRIITKVKCKDFT